MTDIPLPVDPEDIEFDPDELETITVELPNGVWLALAMQAHKLDITLNEYMATVFVAACEEAEAEAAGDTDAAADELQAELDLDAG
jgi:hypothetical protein